MELAPRAKEMVRVACIGDSITYGYRCGASEAETPMPMLAVAQAIYAATRSSQPAPSPPGAGTGVVDDATRECVEAAAAYLGLDGMGALPLKELMARVSHCLEIPTRWGNPWPDFETSPPQLKSPYPAILQALLGPSVAYVCNFGVCVHPSSAAGIFIVFASHLASTLQLEECHRIRIIFNSLKQFESINILRR